MNDRCHCPAHNPAPARLSGHIRLMPKAFRDLRQRLPDVLESLPDVRQLFHDVLQWLQGVGQTLHDVGR